MKLTSDEAWVYIGCSALGAWLAAVYALLRIASALQQIAERLPR